MKDLLLDKDGDLYLTPNGDVSLTDSVRQAILIRLRWFLGGWKFNTSFGLPYFSQIFMKNPNTVVIEQLFRQQILSVAEVIKIESLPDRFCSQKDGRDLSFSARESVGCAGS